MVHTTAPQFFLARTIVAGKPARQDPARRTNPQKNPRGKSGFASTSLGALGLASNDKANR
jgi:hypothetical protein